MNTPAPSSPTATPQRPRVWFLNRSYWPDSEATGQLLTELCEDLADEFEIEVFCGRPNHADRLEAATNRPPRTEHRRGVTIHRLWHTRFSKSSRAGKLLNLVTFTLAALVGTLLRRRPDLVVTETDPFFLPLVGRWLKWRYRCGHVSWLQDIYPDIAIAVGKARDGMPTRLLRRRLVAAYRRADRVVVLSDDMRARLADHGVPPERLAVIHNWADCRCVAPIPHDNPFRREQSLDGRFVVMYSGNLGLAHDLDPLVAAADRLRDAPRFLFLFIGEGVRKEALQRRVQDLELPNVRFLPYQPRERLAESLGAADLHVVSMLPDARGCVMPSKLYGILAAGRPVLSLCPPRSDVSRIVTEHKVGLACPDRADPGVWLSEAILELAADPAELSRQGDCARRLAEREFDRRKQVARFSGLFRNVLGLTDAAHVAPQSNSIPDHPAISAPRFRRAAESETPEPVEVLAG